uniref:Protein kinase AMP-activated catalytic subunit alpha 1 n=1 Tax=Macaca fascicularis TaxID=9541 RepID=A0A2K5TNN7_MACFA
MASFGWKRKIGEKVSKVTSQQFEAEAADEKDVVDNDEGNWLHAIKRRKEILLEGCAEKSKQLKDEGASLAENKRVSLCLCYPGWNSWAPAIASQVAGKLGLTSMCHHTRLVFLYIYIYTFYIYILNRDSLCCPGLSQ